MEKKASNVSLVRVAEKEASFHNYNRTINRRPSIVSKKSLNDQNIKDIDIKIHIENHPRKTIEKEIGKKEMENGKEKTQEIDKETKKKMKREKWFNYFKEFVCCQFGVFSIYILTKYSFFNSVFAASSSMLMTGLIIPRFSIVFLCGGFASLMNPDTLNNPGFLVFTGLISFILYRLTINMFLNIGGRPGTIAFISNLITFLLVYLISLTRSYTYYPMDYIIDYHYFNALNIHIYIFGPLVCMISSLLVYILAEYLKVIIAITHRVIAYAIVCMFKSMYFLTLTTEYRRIIYTDKDNYVPVSYGQMFIHFVHIGTLSGLTLKTRYRKNGNNPILHYCLASLLSGYIGIGFMGVLIFGGKHGIVAFLGNVIYIYSLEYMFPIKEEIKKEIEQKDQIELLKKQVDNEIYNEINKEIKAGMSSTKILECKSDEKEEEIDNKNVNKENSDDLNYNIDEQINNEIKIGSLPYKRIERLNNPNVDNDQRIEGLNKPNEAYEIVFNNDKEYVNRKVIRNSDNKFTQFCTPESETKTFFNNLNNSAYNFKIESFFIKL